MRVVKNILIGLGGLFLVIVALFTWVGVSGSQFSAEQGPFVKKFVADLSKRWEVVDVYDRMSSSFIQQSGTPQAQQLLHQFKRLGALKSVSALKLQSYYSNNNDRTGVFSLEGAFENGEAVIRVTIVRKDGAVRVVGFYLNATHMREGASRIQT